MAEQYFDVDAALKEPDTTPAEVAAHLAQLHNVDRDAYLKEGLSDAEFLNEFKHKSLPGATTEGPQQEVPAVSNVTNAAFGALGAAVPAIAAGGFRRLAGTPAPAPTPAPAAAPAFTYETPEQVRQRVIATGQPPRPQGPEDVVNWAMGKDPKTGGQYSRGYLGGTSMAHEADLHAQADALEAKNPGYKVKQGTSNLLIPQADYDRDVAQKEAARKTAVADLNNKAKMAAELRSQRLTQIQPTMPGKIASAVQSGLQSASESPTLKRGAVGYNVGDYLQAQNPFEKTVSAVGASAPIIAAGAKKVLPARFKPIADLIGTGASVAAPAINYLERKFTTPAEPEQHAEGGQIQGYAGGKLVQQGLSFLERNAPEIKNAVGSIFTPRPTQIVRASEALAPHEGKYLQLTQSDNFGVHDGRMGGNQFPNFQNISPLHQANNVVWMNDAEKHAQDIVNRGGDKNIWSTYIGAPDQLKSNKTVTNDILENHYARDLTPDQIDLINNRIATMRAGKNKTLVFPQPFDIRDKFATQELGTDTFARRAALADILGTGEGVGKTKSGIALPNYEDILQSHRDPLTEGAPTSSIGTRLFSVDKDTPAFYTKDYHPDYDWAVTGKDQGVQFAPVPQNIMVPDWYNEYKSRFPNRDPHGNAWFSYPKNPQFISEDYLRSMEDAGHAEGGHIEGYGGGGKIGILEGIASLAKKVLPATEREANLAKYIESSKVQTPMYHGTSADITQFKPGTSNATFVTSNPDFAKRFSYDSQDKLTNKAVMALDPDAKKAMMDQAEKLAKQKKTYSGDELNYMVQQQLPTGPNVMQVHVNAKNPFDYENPAHVEAVLGKMDPKEWDVNMMRRLLQNPTGNWAQVEQPHVQQAIKDLGHDSFYVNEGGEKNLGLYNPTQIKSATGNVGTFDPTNPDITKKAGGMIHAYKEGGHATPAWQRSEGKNPEGGLNALGRASYNREHGAHLKAPQPEGGSRRDSFCARMEGMREKLTSSETAKDPDSRINKSLRKWKC